MIATEQDLREALTEPVRLAVAEVAPGWGDLSDAAFDDAQVAAELLDRIVSVAMQAAV